MMLYQIVLKCSKQVLASSMTSRSIFQTNVVKISTSQSVSTTFDSRYLKDVPKFDDIELPEQRKLQLLPKLPLIYANTRAPRLRRSNIDARGPERVNNTLLHNQYGIMALCGGYLTHAHYEIIRNTINRYMDARKMFAVWRVDPLWKPVTRKSIGKRMGGGKGNVHHFATPVKAGRIIVEVGGKIEFSEVFPFLNRVAIKMPFDAIVINKDILSKIEKGEEDKERRNINPFTYEYVVKNNMNGYKMFSSPKDPKWHGKYI